MLVRLRLIASVGMILCLAFAGVSGCSRAKGQAGFTMPPAVVTTAPVETADVPVYLDEIGKTTASEVVNIQPQVSGKIIERSFKDGANLTKGEQLFQIDPRPFQAALDQAQAVLQQNQAQFDNAKINFTRVASELPSKAVSQQDYDNAKDSVAVSDANVKAAQAAVETASLNMEYCTIKSPIDGLAGQRLVDVGNVVNANMTSLLIIQKLAPIYVDFTVPENELGRVRQNMATHPLQIQVQSPDDPGKSIAGQVTFLDNSVQDGTGTIKLRATVDNKDRQLWPGQFVQVKLILDTIHGALLIPSEAVQIGQQGPFVYVFKTDPATQVHTAEQATITPGQRQGPQIVVDKGLSADETVVRSGQMTVIPGAPVVLESPSGAKP